MSEKTARSDEIENGDRETKKDDPRKRIRKSHSGSKPHLEHFQNQSVTDLVGSLPVAFAKISVASLRIRPGIPKTPLDIAHDSMMKRTGMKMYFKKEYVLPTGSFKERGARFALLSLTREQRLKGVIAASAGNHALAMSYHGKDLGIKVTVVMPKVAPLMKVSRCSSYDAEVIIFGDHIGQSKEHAMNLAAERGMKYINGYDDVDVIAGQGTIGVEIMEQLDSVDAIVVPIGGGGLVAGISLAAKTLNPECKVIGVEAASCPSWQVALEKGKPFPAEVKATLADGLAVPVVGENAFSIGKHFVDKVVSVSERHVAIAILNLLEDEKAVVEGAGATGLAACLSGQLKELEGKRVVVILCGGNIDTTVLGRCIERGMAAEGRLVKFKCVIDDLPGGVSKLTGTIAAAGASIKDIYHERAWLETNVFSVQVRLIVETRDWNHALLLRNSLVSSGYLPHFGRKTDEKFAEIELSPTKNLRT